MTDNTTIPLNKLLAWDGNVRKTEPDKGIDELAASIAAHGLLSSLVVRKERRGKYAVVAGRRRLMALKLLAEEGKVGADMEIPCGAIGVDADASEISLAENVLREPMHPADEFEAFKELVEKGTPVADVAARFGVSETVVEKRLKLARVSPALIAAYRAGEMTLEHVMAFTVTDDHAAQEQVWNKLPEWRRGSPDVIRRMLTTDRLDAGDSLVKFVTLEAYQEAGGTVSRDLFSEGDEGVFIDDLTLLESLAARKLDEAAEALRKEGWKWVEVRSSYDHDEWSKCQRVYPEAAPLPEQDAAEMEALTAEYEALCEFEEADDEQQARMDAMSERMEELESGPAAWTPETLAIAGAVVTVGHNGEVKVHAGLVKPEDATDRAGRADRKKGAARESAVSASLIESLTAQRSAALNAVLMKQPAVALAAVVHALALGVFYLGARDGTALQITANAQSLHRVQGSTASDMIEAAEQEWAERIPLNPERLFDWCLSQPQETLMELLAFCAAQTVNAVRRKIDGNAASRIEHATRLAEAVKLDMTQWFTPTAANYFGKTGKAQIIDALREAKGTVSPAWNAMKKSELAAIAERQIAGTGWLPEPLRAPAPDAEPEA